MHIPPLVPEDSSPEALQKHAEAVLAALALTPKQKNIIASEIRNAFSPGLLVSEFIQNGEGTAEDFELFSISVRRVMAFLDAMLKEPSHDLPQ